MVAILVEAPAAVQVANIVLVVVAPMAAVVASMSSHRAPLLQLLPMIFLTMMNWTSHLFHQPFFWILDDL